MHLFELVELAAVVAHHGPALVAGHGRLSPAGIEQYWLASKFRLDRWGRALRRLTDDPRADDPNRAGDFWVEARPLVEEILASEVLTRTWTALACAFDRARASDDAEPIARSIFVAHQEARHRALRLIARGPSDSRAATAVNRLRRRAERWNDLLVGHLASHVPQGECALEQMAIHPQRARDFAEDLAYQRRQGLGMPAWHVTLTSLRASFRRSLNRHSPNADLNSRISEAILSCFPAEAFDTTGLFPSLWLARLTNVASDTEGLLAELLAAENLGPAPQRFSPWA